MKIFCLNVQVSGVYEDLFMLMGVCVCVCVCVQLEMGLVLQRLWSFMCAQCNV